MKARFIVFAAVAALSMAVVFPAITYSADEAAQAVSDAGAPAQAEPEAKTEATANPETGNTAAQNPEPAAQPEPAGTETAKPAGKTEAGQKTENPAEKQPVPETPAHKEYAVGMILITHKDFAKAAEHLEKSLKLDPSSYNTHLLLAQVYTRVNKHANSVNLLQNAIKLKPNQVDAYDLLMQLYLYLQKPEKALDTADAAIKAGIPDTALPDLGWTYYQLGKLDEAEAIYNKYIDKYGESFGPLRNLGLVNYERGNYEKSLEYYEKAEKLDPENRTLPYLKMQTYEKLGNEGALWREAAMFKMREHNLLRDLPKFNKLYFPHSKPANLNKYIFLLKDKPEMYRGGPEAPKPSGEAPGTEPAGQNTPAATSEGEEKPAPKAADEAAPSGQDKPAPAEK